MCHDDIRILFFHIEEQGVKNDQFHALNMWETNVIKIPGIINYFKDHISSPLIL